MGYLFINLLQISKVQLISDIKAATAADFSQYNSKIPDKLISVEFTACNRTAYYLS